MHFGGGGGDGGEDFFFPRRQRLGLLMRAMLRMMELRGLTNFGKRGGGGGKRRWQGGERGIWGLLLLPV